MYKILNKEYFCEVIRAIQKQEKEDESLEKVLKQFLVGNFFVTTGNHTKIILLNLLKELTNDKENFIGWYLYEDVKDRTVHINNEEKMVVNTPEDLYDLLIKLNKEEIETVKENKDSKDSFEVDFSDLEKVLKGLGLYK